MLIDFFALQDIWEFLDMFEAVFLLLTRTKTITFLFIFS